MRPTSVGFARLTRSPGTGLPCVSSTSPRIASTGPGSATSTDSGQPHLAPVRLARPLEHAHAPAALERDEALGRDGAREVEREAALLVRGRRAQAEEHARARHGRSVVVDDASAQPARERLLRPREHEGDARIGRERRGALGLREALEHRDEARALDRGQRGQRETPLRVAAGRPAAVERRLERPVEARLEASPAGRSARAPAPADCRARPARCRTRRWRVRRSAAARAACRRARPRCARWSRPDRRT